MQSAGLSVRLRYAGAGKGRFMGLLALFLFIVLPAIEIYLFIEIGGALGAGWTIVLIFLTAAIGVSAMRRQGLTVLQEAQAAQNAGRPPLAAVAHGVLILLGGLLLLVPGFFTDGLGFLCLWRPARRFFIAVLLEALLPHIIRMRPMRPMRGDAQAAPDAPESDTKTIEGDYRIDDD
jgi:UPF0716 protein FxsA